MFLSAAGYSVTGEGEGIAKLVVGTRGFNLCITPMGVAFWGVVGEATKGNLTGVPAGTMGVPAGTIGRTCIGVPPDDGVSAVTAAMVTEGRVGVVTGLGNSSLALTSRSGEGNMPYSVG